MTSSINNLIADSPTVNVQNNTKKKNDVNFGSETNNFEKSPEKDEVSFYQKHKTGINILVGASVGDIVSIPILKAAKIQEFSSKGLLICLLCDAIGAAIAGFMTHKTKNKS